MTPRVDKKEIEGQKEIKFNIISNEVPGMKAKTKKRKGSFEENPRKPDQKLSEDPL